MRYDQFTTLCIVGDSNAKLRLTLQNFVISRNLEYKAGPLMQLLLKYLGCAEMGAISVVTFTFLAGDNCCLSVYRTPSPDKSPVFLCSVSNL